MKTWRRLVVLLLALALVGAACGSDDKSDDSKGSSGGSSTTQPAPKPSITVGSANFAESSLVASMYAQVLEHAGYKVTTKLDVGARDVYYAALEKGELDLVPEFAGSLTAFLKGTGDADPAKAVENLKKVLPDSLTALEASPSQSANTFVVTKETADKYGLKSVSDLAGHEGDLTLGGPPECPQRPFCMQGLKSTYNVDFTSHFKALDAGGPLTKDALKKGDIQVALLFTTDPGIKLNNWVQLEDDKHLQQAESVIPIIRKDKDSAALDELINAVSAKLDQDSYVDLLTKVYVDGDDVKATATKWLEDNGFLK